MQRKKEIAEELSIIGPELKSKFFSDFTKRFDVSQSQWLTIVCLAQSGGCNFSALSKMLNVSAPTVTGVVDSLEKSKYAKRVYDKSDRRSINVELTEKGAKFASDMRKSVVSHWEEMLGKISVKDGEKLLQIFKEIIAD
jgi:DNA-binding MarR family transcriptional regulator